MRWPCSVNDYRPLRLFRCVQTSMGLMNKTWYGIGLIERDGVYAIYYFYDVIHDLCVARRHLLLFSMTMDVFFVGCLLYLMDAKQRGCNPKSHILCTRKHIFLMFLFLIMIVSKGNITQHCCIILIKIHTMLLFISLEVE